MPKKQKTIDDKEFADWDGSTGYHLPKDDWVVNKAAQVARYHNATH